jgi:hypothetical protein
MMMWPLPAEEPRNDPRPPAPGPDDSLSTRVSERLRSDPLVGRHSLTVQVQSGVVLLSGTVDSAAAREAASRIVRDTDGVRDVCTMVGAAAPGAGPEQPHRSGFDDIAAGLLADDPSLADPPPVPRSTTSWVVLAVLAAVAWGLVSLLLVTAPWIALVVACAALAVAVELVQHRRRPARRRGHGRGER